MYVTVHNFPVLELFFILGTLNKYFLNFGTPKQGNYKTLKFFRAFFSLACKGSWCLRNLRAQNSLVHYNK